MHGISYRPTDLSLLKEFSKKSVLKIFIIIFEQDCPEAVVHEWTQRYHEDLGCQLLDISYCVIIANQFWY